MKKIKLSIIFIIILIIIVIVTLIIYNQKLDDINGEAKVREENVKPIELVPVQQEENMADYLLVDELIDNFFSYVSEKYENINNGEAAYGLLDKEYIKDNKITKENVLKVFEKYNNLDSYTSKEMYTEKRNENEDYVNQYFYVKGTVRNNGNKEEVYILLKKDMINDTFSIQFLEEGEYNSVSQNGKNEQERFEIKSTEYNKLYVKTISDYDVCLKHMEEYKKALKNDIGEAYELLDKEYRDRRFGNIENFEKYRERKQEIYENENFTKYLVNEYDTYTQYVCKDQYGNLYIFEETLPMQYTLKLDTYTINTEKFKKEYENGNEEKKVQLDINKFVLMISNQDYENAYKLLDEDFKNNYFKTQRDFENYIKEYMYKYSKIEFTNFEVIGKNYVCQANITDSTNGIYEDETKGTGGSGYVFEWKFFVKLEEDTDFKLSFEVK